MGDVVGVTRRVVRAADGQDIGVPLSTRQQARLSCLSQNVLEFGHPPAIVGKENVGEIGYCGCLASWTRRAPTVGMLVDLAGRSRRG
jgi:hypothetical protein